MITKESLKSEIDNIDAKHLETLYIFIKSLQQHRSPNHG